MSFKNIKGQDNIISKIKKIALNDIFSSIIFYGEEGIGKLKTAIELAKATSCQKRQDNQLFEGKNTKEEDIDSCDLCSNCLQIEKRIHPDIRIIDYQYQANILDEEIEKQKTIKIDTIRQATQFAYQKNYILNKKFLIIDNANTLTIEAQNSLLKLLEEPPKNTFIILITNNLNLLLPTIISRSIALKFNPLKKEILKEILLKNSVESHIADFLSEISNGSVKKAMDYQEILSTFYEKKTQKNILPFIFHSSSGAQTYELRNKAKILADFLIAVIKKEKLSENNIKTIKNIEGYVKYLNQNISPRPLIELMIHDFLKTDIKLYKELA